MKGLFVVLAALGCTTAQRQFRPIPASQPGQHIAIVSQSQDVNFDGSYQYSYESENGIRAQEQGRPKSGNAKEAAEEVSGSFQYVSPEGNQIDLQYVADENGFQPQGNHLPVAPPIPPAILRALEWNAAHPEQDDGGEQPGRPFRRQQ